MRILIILIIGLFPHVVLHAQNPVVFGTVKDIDSDQTIGFVTVYEKGTSNASESDIDGLYRLVVPIGQKTTLVFSRIGYNETEVNVPAMPSGAKHNINVQLTTQGTDIDIIIRSSRIEDLGMVREEVVELTKIPTATGNLESVLPHIALGTSSGTGGELSSQYNVRGGNYDENLVYVNDFEIFRPQLIRSGQQEGLTFPNIDLIRNLSFSSGGFEARYGDKLSSVLDIKYKRPEETKGSIGFSFLGASTHVEGSKKLGPNAYNKFRYLVGARYKTTRYVLGSLDTRGEYLPNFFDLQAYLTYNFTKDLQLGFISNINTSTYFFRPESRKTATGLINFAIQLESNFEGQEEDEFSNTMSGLSLTYIPERDRNPLYLKFLGSGFINKENEQFDILGDYTLSELEIDLGAEETGQTLGVLGSGLQQSYARNFLYSQIFNLEHKGGIELQSNSSDERTNFVQWSIKYQRESIEDDLHEWERLDSAGFSLPFDENAVRLSYFIDTDNVLNSNRFSSYLQNAFTNISDNAELKITGGVRASYWDLNKELVISPRVQLLYKPLNWSRDFSLKLAGGVYYQPPFYRELRRPDGTVNLNLKSQRSIHAVAGITYDFVWGNTSPTKFKLIAEAYYKKLDNLVSYEIDNVRIRYSGENDATGYIAGLDLRLNGEFVPGAESWINLSFLRARENLKDVQHKTFSDSTNVDTDFVPRPTDQFMTLSMFFQDYLPRNKNFKTHLNMTVGTGLPFGIKDNNQVLRNAFRFRAYHRVDIGFSYQLWSQDRRKKYSRSPFKFSKNAWVSLEVFNLMKVKNVASNTWIKTVGQRQYAIPNFLTSRRINIRFKFDL